MRTRHTIVVLFAIACSYLGLQAVGSIGGGAPGTSRRALASSARSMAAFATADAGFSATSGMTEEALAEIQAEAAVEEDVVIHVKKALWSGKDVTAAAAEHCDNAFSCDYKVSTAYVGEAQNPAKKSFSIQWTCGTAKTAKIYSHVEAHDATDKIFTIDCQAQYLSATHPGTVFPLRGLKKWATSKYPYSFSALLRNGKADAYEKEFTPACLREVKKIYASGKTLAVPHFKTQLSLLKDYAFPSGVSDLTFFHYTKAESMRAIARKSRPLDIFKYLRLLNSQDLSTSAWNEVLYMAEDPESSADYGNIQVRIQMRSDTNVFDERPDFADGKRSYDIVWSQLTQRFPALVDACSETEFKDKDGIPVPDPYLLYFLSAEDSGVDVIRYADFVQGWFQVLNPFAIDHLETD